MQLLIIILRKSALVNEISVNFVLCSLLSVMVFYDDRKHFLCTANAIRLNISLSVKLVNYVGICVYVDYCR